MTRFPAPFILLLILEGCGSPPSNPAVLPFDRSFFPWAVLSTDERVVVVGEDDTYGHRTARIIGSAVPHERWTTISSHGDSKIVSVAVSGEMNAAVILSVATRGRELLRTRDGGGTWETSSGIPEDVFAARMLDGSDGFAWDDGGAYRIKKGELGPRLERPDLLEVGAPSAVDAKGRLWIAQRRGYGGSWRHSLIAVDEGLHITARLETDDTIDEMSSDGAFVWLLFREGGYGAAKLARLTRDEERDQVVTVGDLGSDLPVAMAVRGARIGVILGKTDGMRADRRILISEDGWMTWSHAGSQADLPDLLCLGAERAVWIIGRSAAIRLERDSEGALGE